MPQKEGLFPAQLFDTASYDPEPARERIRGLVTLSSSSTFLIIVVFYLYQTTHSTDTTWPHVKDAMQAILPAVTSVLGTALGFYFGSQKRS